MECPSDFEPDLNNACRMKCPPGFKYLQQPGGDKCVYEKDNRYTLDLQSIPPGVSDTAFTEERNRLYGQLEKVQGDIEAQRQVTNRLPDYEAQHKAFQTNYAGFKSMQENTNLLKDALQDVRPMRAKTAPADIGEEYKKIISIRDEDVRMVQVALLTILVCLIVYLVVPTPFSHGIAFLFACAGIAVGIFLMTSK